MESIRNHLYNILTTDSELQTLLGGTVKLYNLHAIADADFPYLVHRLESGADTFWPLRQGTYIVDIWVDERSTDTIYDIRNRIVALIDELNFTTSAIDRGELWLQTDGLISEPQDGIYHYALQFNLRYYRTAETETIIERS